MAIGIHRWEKMAGGSGTSLSGTLNVNGTDRVVYIAVVFDAVDTTTISSPTLDSVPMTSLKRETFDNGAGVNVGIELFRLVNPAIAVATFSGTLSVSAFWHVIGACFTGVHQVTPNNTVFSADSGGVNNLVTVDVTGTATDELVVDFAGLASVSSTIIAGANQTDRQNNNNDGLRTGGSSEPGTGGTVTMSWDVNQNDGWVTIATTLNQVDSAVALMPQILMW